MDNITNNVNTTGTGTSATINTNSWWTYNYTPEKSCDTCIHEGVCKYESECRKVMKQAKKMLDPTEGRNKLWLSINTSCNYYRAESFNITCGNNVTAVPPIYDKNIEITC